MKILKYSERPLPIKPDMMPTFPEYRNKRRQTDRKEERKGMFRKFKS